jgi:transposase-like protein
LRDVEEMLEEHCLEVDHTTVWRWVQRYGPETRPAPTAAPQTHTQIVSIYTSAHPSH